MCETCGCELPSVRTIAVEQPLLASNAENAQHNRAHFAARKILTINLMGAPGAGKTALLETTIKHWRSPAQVVVIEGDQATDRDSARIRSAGAQAYQVETGLGCHLDAAQIHRALHHLELAEGDVLFVENVGNLVCPALFDLGEHLRVLVTSPTEGIDKPLKYPPMFRAADIVVLNKCDLIPHLRFELDEWTEYIRSVNPRAQIFEVSATAGHGVRKWLSQLDCVRRAFQSGHERAHE
jgi:hydrogenase nickel incorporation protein HypB